MEMGTGKGLKVKVPSVERLISAVCLLSLLPVPCLAPILKPEEVQFDEPEKVPPKMTSTRKMPTPLTPGQVFDKVKAGVVVVKTLDAQGKMTKQGSGMILPSGRVATNHHVVERGTSYRVGRGKQLVPATLYAEDGDKDICLLDAKGIKGKPAQLGKAARLKVGNPVYALGAPKGMELSLSDGIVAQLHGGPPPFIQTTATISPGSSGGGLFDGEGRLVGLTTFYLEGVQSLNFAMPVEWIDGVKPGSKLAAEGIDHAEWLKRAAALKTMKDWQGLLEWCLKWTKSEPENADAWYNLGIAYGVLRRYDDAIEACRQAVRINPEFALAWHNLGLAYSSLNRHNDAIEAYRQAVRINPEDADAWYNLGVAYGFLRRYDDSIEACRQAIRINPEFALTWYNLGLAYSSLNRHNEAIEAYRKAVRINPEDADAWYNLGVAYGFLRRYDDSIEACRQAIRINPEFALTWYNLGLAYSLSGNKTAALSAVQELRRLNPTLADELFNRMVPC
jgi:tetratricopeptide (TPR) repeat protein